MSIFLLNIEFKETDNLYNSLKEIFGISHGSIYMIYKKLGLNFRYKWLFQNLNEYQINILKNFLKDNFVFESELIKKNIQDINKIKKLRTFKFVRFSKGLPVRGQRTHTNGNTSKKLNKNMLVIKYKKKK